MTATRDEKKLEVGDVIGKAFEVWLKNLIAFAVITLIVYSPVILLTVLNQGSDPASAQKMQLFTSIVQMALGSVAAGALTYGVLQALRGKPISIGECISTGFGRLLPVLGVSLLVGVCVGVGLVLLVVPGLILMCMLAVAVPVAVVEKPGVMASLSRSSELTKGFKWTIFFVFLALILLGMLISLVLAIPFAMMGTLGIVIATSLSLVISGALQAALPAVIYQRLRDIKEGASVEDLAKVFD
ncbi:MAG TPA: hypothetical protein VND21_05150 [Planctomycetota bacterium]|nr:hypothetical protein [Planctomycetota bacterium]